jgi:PAS domain S-box-containing protein
VANRKSRPSTHSRETGRRTEQRHALTVAAEEALHESQRIRRLILDNVDEIIYMVEGGVDNARSGRVRFVSGRVEQILGYRPEEFIRDRDLWFGLIHPDDVPAVADSTRAIIASGQVGMREYRIRHKRTGDYHWIEDRVVPQLDGAGVVIGQFGVARDITERKRAEKARQDAKSRLRAVLNNAPITIFATDNQGVFTLSDGKGLERVGLKPGENVGASALHLFGSLPFVEHSGEMTDGKNVVRRALAGETVTAVSELHGVYFDNHIGPLRNTDGEVIGLVGVATDITERQHTLEALRSSEVRFRGLLESAPDATVVVNTGGEIAFFNAAAEKVFGYSRSEVLGQTVDILIPERFRALHWRQQEGYIAAPKARPMGSGLELYGRRKDGSQFSVDIMLGPLELHGKLVVMCIVRDITERKQAEEESARLYEQVRASRERLRQLAQQVVFAHEEERRRISHELHDEAGQALTALRISLELMREKLPTDLTAVRQGLSNCIALIETTSERIHSLAQDLRPPGLDAVGLGATLEGFCLDFAKRTQLSIAFVGGDVPALPENVAISFYRFLQEALTNVAKHAHASHVWVALQVDADGISLSVRDDGRGFDVPSTRVVSGRSKGLGLIGMQERLGSLGGRVEIVSQPGQGTRLIARVTRKELV